MTTDAEFEQIYAITDQIDTNLVTSRRHYYNTAGQLLISLDQVVNAILTGNLMTGEPSDHHLPANNTIFGNYDYSPDPALPVATEELSEAARSHRSGSTNPTPGVSENRRARAAMRAANALPGRAITNARSAG